MSEIGKICHTDESNIFTVVDELMRGRKPECLSLRAKDLADNNFPKLVCLWNGTIVPARKDVIEEDTHRFEEIRRTLFARRIDPRQNIHGHLQPLGGLRLFHEVLGDGDRMEHHTLTGPGHMGKEAVLDRVVLRTVGRILRHPDFQAHLIREGLQRLLEHMPIGGVAAPAIAQQQQAVGVGKVLMAMLAPPVGDAIAAEFTGVVTGVEVDIPFVPRHVINAMRNQFAFARAGKIMV